MKKNYLSIALCGILLSSQSLIAQDQNEKIEEIDSITIVEDTTPSYTSNIKPGLLRGDIDLADTAKSVQVFTKEFIQDYQVQDVNDAITMSSNTIYEGDNHGRTTDISMRGFSGVPILIDGLKVSSSLAHPEVFNLESIEVLKGADSLQFGESSPGGIVNVSTKKPIKESSGEIQLEVSDNTSYSPKLDIGGSLNEDQSLYYRFVSVFEHDEGSDSTNTDTKKIFLAPSIAYDINDNNKITFVTEYTKETAPLSFGTYVDSDGKLVDGYENTSSNPDEEFTLTQKIFGVDLESTFGDWDSIFRYRYTNYIYDSGAVHMPFKYIESTANLMRFYASQKNTTEDNSLQYTLNTQTKLFDLKNKISIGFDYDKYSSQQDMFADLTTFYTIDYSNPSYESLSSESDHSTLTDMSSAKSYTKTWGTFIKDTIYLNNNLVLNAGLRYSKINPETSDSTKAISPSLGLVKHISSKTSVYTSYSESFTPNTTKDVNGDLLDPETGKGAEIGIRQKLFNDNLNLTAALFKIKKVNVSEVDSANSVGSNNVYTASGEQTSQGFEIDLNGNVTPELSLVASYGYTDVKDKDNDNNELVDIPKHTANLFAKYNLIDFSLPNFDITGGVNYIGSKYADSANTIKLDSAMIFNASIAYTKDNWKTNLSIHNLSDEEYVDGTMVSNANGTRVYAGNDRRIVANIGYSF